MKTFKAPWGRSTILLTLGFTALTLYFTYEWHHLFTFDDVGHYKFWVYLLPLIILVAAALFCVRGYTVTPEAVLVKRLFWNTTIPLRSLINMEARPNAMKGSMRVCGNGGIFGFVGWFYSTPLKSYRAYVTSRKSTVILCFPRQTFVVSPDDPEGFTQEVLSQRPSA